MTKQSPPPKKRRGPAPTGVGRLIGVRLQPDALARIDAWSRNAGGTPTRPEAIRRLLELGLSGSKKRTQ